MISNKQKSAVLSVVVLFIVGLVLLLAFIGFIHLCRYVLDLRWMEYIFLGMYLLMVHAMLRMIGLIIKIVVGGCTKRELNDIIRMDF